MRGMFLMLLMLLSTASARTLKNAFDPDTDRPGCGHFFFCVSSKIYESTTIKIYVNAGERKTESFDYNYIVGYCTEFEQASYMGPDVTIEFYNGNGDMIHTGNYQQNYCLLEAGAITTNDHNAEIEINEGSYPRSEAGSVVIRSL